MVELSVIVPVYNSAGCLEELYRQLADALKGRVYELILVDDQSADGSWRVIKGLCEKDRAVVGVRLRKNAGQDNAILSGLRKARGAFAVIMDDDLQHSPYDIPRLHAHCVSQELDVCYAHFSTMKHAWWKRAGGWLNGKLAEIVIAKPKHLYLSPFKVVRREVVAEVIKYTGAFPYVDGLLLGITYNVGQSDAAHNARFCGASTYSLAKSVLVFMRVATGFSVWPLRFSAWVGLVLALAGFSLAVFFLLQYVLLEQHVEGWMTIVTLQLVIGGAMLLSIGLVGEYLGRLYLNCNGKPQATIKESVNECRG
jgi:undecaprenyl-phosphate 4-deoxy-4-formamido-L-arabinose transferase